MRLIEMICACGHSGLHHTDFGCQYERCPCEADAFDVAFCAGAEKAEKRVAELEAALATYRNEHDFTMPGKVNGGECDCETCAQARAVLER